MAPTTTVGAIVVPPTGHNQPVNPADIVTDAQWTLVVLFIAAPLLVLAALLAAPFVIGGIAGLLRRRRAARSGRP